MKPALLQTEAVPEALTPARSTMEGAQEELDKYFVRKFIFNKGSK